jgi:hypothetical protein
MLSHIGHQILGMNTIQLYMKVRLWLEAASPVMYTCIHFSNSLLGSYRMSVSFGAFYHNDNRNTTFQFV